MSYLRSPRLIFGGKFQADPSTVNNDPEHFDTANWKPEYQNAGDSDGWWNPNGTGAWRLKDCVVTRVVYADGTTCDDATIDPIVGTPVTDTLSGTEGKIVDLDSENQSTSQIWGLEVIIGKPAAGLGFSGDYAVASFLDLGTRATDSGGGGDIAAGAAWHSVLEPITWAGTGTSRYLKELAASGAPSNLSIKFNVDGYNLDSQSTDFTFGRIVGSIGPQIVGEPSFFVAGRAIGSTANSPMSSAYAEIVDNTLTIDLGNSLSTGAPGGALADVGPIDLVILPPNTVPIVLGAIPYLTQDFYTKTAGIVTFTLTGAQLHQASTAPLAIVPNGSATPLLAEPNDGLWVRADSTVFRLNPGDVATTTFYATRFGQPASGLTISFGYDPTIMQQQTNQGPIPGPQTVGTPTSALTFPTSIKTAANGMAVLTLNASDPGNPRTYIDGQVYGVTYGPGNTPPAVGTVLNASRILNVLVWSGFTAPATPTWTHDVEPILQQYANLYPVMKQYVHLGDFNSVVAMASSIKQVFSLPTTDPLYMPVTRDLSAAKKAMILTWLDHPVM